MPNNINLDDLLRHQVTLSRLETSAYQSHIAPSLAQALRDIRRLLADAETITSRRQLNALEAEIKRVIRAESGWAAMQSELNQLADYDNRFFANLVGAGTVAASSERVKHMADNTMMVLRSGEKFNSGLWPDFVRGNQDAQIAAVSNVLRTAYAEGWDARQMRREVSRRFDGEIARNADTLARTATNHYATMGRRAFAEANSDIVAREVPIVTFDDRTTSKCVSISARYAEKGWPVGQSPIGYAPWHWGCRSTVVPLAEGQELIGTKSARGASQRSEQVRASTSISNFVKRQPKKWQEDLLGVKRAQLFREGKLDLRNLTDASLMPLTLKQIAQREGIKL